MTNNLINPGKILKRLLVIFLISFSTGLYAQDTSFTRPPITDDWDKYRKQVALDSNKKMIELRTLIPSIIYDLRYATLKNFMRRLMYPAGTRETYLRLPAAKALKNVQLELKQKGYGLKIYDAYRPYSVTVKFWELVKDERYVANPSRGSGHNRGIAVDLTIIDEKTRKELEMGTGFDNFSDTAHHSYQALPQQVLNNRTMLKELMEKHGFRSYNEEWWHYSWPEAARFEILDLDFKKLKKPI